MFGNSKPLENAFGDRKPLKNAFGNSKPLENASLADHENMLFSSEFSGITEDSLTILIKDVFNRSAYYTCVY